MKTTIMYAKKSLGQHFLTSQKALAQIRDAADLTAEDIVLEIGPGLGALTEILLIFAGKVIAVEKDTNLARILKEKFAAYIENKRLDLIEDDILSFDPELLRFYKNFTYKIVANIPYNITGAILKKFLSAHYQPEQMVLLVQKEVAERIIARDHKESILSISVKAYGTPTLIAKVPRGAFQPAPNVDSAIISIREISREHFKNINEDLFFSLVRAGFASKRKKVIKNLEKVLPKKDLVEIFKKLSLNENTRAEDIPITTWIELSRSAHIT